MKSYYFTACPLCGAHLDPGELCDCVLAAYDEKKEAPIPAATKDRSKANISKITITYFFKDVKEGC